MAGNKNFKGDEKMRKFEFIYETETGIATLEVIADNIIDAKRKASKIDSDAVDCLLEWNEI